MLSFKELFIHPFNIFKITGDFFPCTTSQLDTGKQYEYTPPTQPPIRPPYEQACHLRKNNLLSKEEAESSEPR